MSEAKIRAAVDTLRGHIEQHLSLRAEHEAAQAKMHELREKIDTKTAEVLASHSALYEAVKASIGSPLWTAPHAAPADDSIVYARDLKSIEGAVEAVNNPDADKLKAALPGVQIVVFEPPPGCGYCARPAGEKHCWWCTTAQQGDLPRDETPDNSEDQPF